MIESIPNNCITCLLQKLFCILMPWNCRGWWRQRSPSQHPASMTYIQIEDLRWSDHLKSPDIPIVAFKIWETEVPGHSFYPQVIQIQPHCCKSITATNFTKTWLLNVLLWLLFLFCSTVLFTWLFFLCIFFLLAPLYTVREIIIWSPAAFVSFTPLACVCHVFPPHVLRDPVSSLVWLGLCHPAVSRNLACFPMYLSQGLCCLSLSGLYRPLRVSSSSLVSFIHRSIVPFGSELWQ